MKRHLEDLVGGITRVRCGWRIDRDEDRPGEEEWLLFMGGESHENSWGLRGRTNSKNM